MINLEQQIVNIFMQNVYGKKPQLDKMHMNHDGKEGHWLEKQMGIIHNSNNKADLLGYEMKNETHSKTTFGDWSADYYLFNDKTYHISRNDFLQYFGKPNPLKNNRFSWSGTPIPTIKHSSSYNGSILFIDVYSNIFIIYNFNNDPRSNKNTIIPYHLQKENLILAKWSKDNLEQKLLRKFGDKGWFKCYKNPAGFYSKIAFGAPMDFYNWIELVKEGIVYFDSGMYQGNSRNYSQWRANNNYWESLIISYYP